MAPFGERDDRMKTIRPRQCLSEKKLLFVLLHLNKTVLDKRLPAKTRTIYPPLFYPPCSDYSREDLRGQSFSIEHHHAPPAQVLQIVRSLL